MLTDEIRTLIERRNEAALEENHPLTQAFQNGINALQRVRTNIEGSKLPTDVLRRRLWVALMAAGEETMPADWDPIQCIGEVRDMVEAKGNERLLDRVSDVYEGYCEEPDIARHKGGDL